MIPPLLTQFIGQNQLLAIRSGLRGEERDWFKEKLKELADMIAKMPHSYATDGQGNKAIVYLHYFGPGRTNWYITERDSSTEQLQAFGRAVIHDGEGELGYISIAELIQNNVELDLHFQPCRLDTLKKII